MKSGPTFSWITPNLFFRISIFSHGNPIKRGPSASHLHSEQSFFPPLLFFVLVRDANKYAAAVGKCWAKLVMVEKGLAARAPPPPLGRGVLFQKTSFLRIVFHRLRWWREEEVGEEFVACLFWEGLLSSPGHGSLTVRWADLASVFGLSFIFFLLLLEHGSRWWAHEHTHRCCVSCHCHFGPDWRWFDLIWFGSDWLGRFRNCRVGWQLGLPGSERKWSTFKEWFEYISGGKWRGFGMLTADDVVFGVNWWIVVWQWHPRCHDGFYRESVEHIESILLLKNRATESKKHFLVKTPGIFDNNEYWIKVL